MKTSRERNRMSLRGNNSESRDLDSWGLSTNLRDVGGARRSARKTLWQRNISAAAPATDDWNDRRPKRAFQKQKSRERSSRGLKQKLESSGDCPAAIKRASEQEQSGNQSKLERSRFGDRLETRAKVGGSAIRESVQTP